MASQMYKNKFILDQSNNKKEKIPIRFDVAMLNMLIGYTFKSSKTITRKSLTNLKLLFNLIDIDIYQNDEEKLIRVEFIQNVLEARIDKGFENEAIILNYCRAKDNNKLVEDIIQNVELYKKINYEEIKFLNKMIQDRLTFSFIVFYKEELYQILEKIESGTYKTYEDANKDMLNICNLYIQDSRKIKNVNNQNIFSLEPEIINDILPDIITRLQNPAKLFKTGIRRLNELLSPGFKSGKLYIFLALPGNFKSVILLKIALDIKKYNKDSVEVKPGKRPMVLLLILENGLAETIERLFNMTVSNDSIQDFTPKEVLRMLQEEGGMMLKDDKDVDIVIRYFGNREIDTNDIRTMIQDYNDENKETVALIVDYIKRVKPHERAKDEKEELKNVSNELANISKEFDIPVVTAHQLNREGQKTIDAGMQANKQDLLNLLGRGNVGSSWEIIENSDWNCIIGLEEKVSTKERYLTFKRIKTRYRPSSNASYFNHPIDPDNGIRLLDDIYLDKSLSEDSLASDLKGVDLMKKGKKNAATREEIDFDDDEDTLFDFDKKSNKKK